MSDVDEAVKKRGLKLKTLKKRIESSSASADDKHWMLYIVRKLLPDAIDEEGRQVCLHERERFKPIAEKQQARIRELEEQLKKLGQEVSRWKTWCGERGIPGPG